MKVSPMRLKSERASAEDEPKLRSSASAVDEEKQEMSSRINEALQRHGLSPQLLELLEQEVAGLKALLDSRAIGARGGDEEDESSGNESLPFTSKSTDASLRRRRKSVGRHLALRSGKNVMDLFQGRGRLSELMKSNRRLYLAGDAGQAEAEHHLAELWKEGTTFTDIEEAGKNFVQIMTRTNKGLIDQAVGEWADEHLINDYDKHTFGEDLRELLRGIFKGARPLLKMCRSRRVRRVCVYM